MRRAVLLTFALFVLLTSSANAFVYEKTRVPMRDGTELSVEIWRPNGSEGQKIPVVLHLTPYHVLSPTNSDTRLPLVDGAELVNDGYAFVFADVRGTWASGGCWDYGGPLEQSDGYDLVEWLGARDWSNGKVAMMGVSYPGTTPNAAAVAQPPHLATIIPISGISRWYGYAYQQGVRATYSGESDDADPPSDTPTDFMFAYGFLPPPDQEALSTGLTQTAARWNLCDRVAQTLHGYSTQPDYDSFWKARDYLRLADRVKVPVLLSHGLLDFNVKTWEGTQWWQAINAPKALVLGQWPHAYPSAYEGWDDLLHRWLARWLLDDHNGVENEPRVHVQTNDGDWHDQADWGPAETTTRGFRLSGGDFSYADDPTLSESEMLRGAGKDVSWTQVDLPDTAGLRFEGRPVLKLDASSDSVGTHFVSVLTDVAPDGTQTVVSRAALNARYRAGLEQGVDLEPKAVAVFPLEFIDKDWVVAPDHHLRLLIASSNATWFLSDEHRAQNTLHLDHSVLELPVYTGPRPPAAAPAAPVAAPPAPAPAKPAAKPTPKKRKLVCKTRKQKRTKACKRAAAKRRAAARRRHRRHKHHARR